jgi:hypothetical protein
VISNEVVNTPPDKPATPCGENEGVRGIEMQFSTSTIESNDNRVYFQWNWDDNTYSDWLGPYESEETCYASHSWNDSGSYDIKVRARDEFDLAGGWSDGFDIHILRFLCGDMNADGMVNLTDILNLISNVYVEPLGQPEPTPPESADVDNSGSLNLTDILNLISHVYGNPPAVLNCPD